MVLCVKLTIHVLFSLMIFLEDGHTLMFNNHCFESAVIWFVEDDMCHNVIRFPQQISLDNFSQPEEA